MFGSATQALGLLRTELAGLEPEALGGPEACELLRICAALSALAQAGATLAAGRVATSEAFRAARARTARGYVSGVCGIAVSAAEAMINLAERLGRFPATAALLRAGTISPAEADQVTRAAARRPSAEAPLLDIARSESFSRLKEAANATQSPDPDDDRRRAEEARRARAVRTWVDADGVGHLHARGPADQIGILAGRIGARADELFAAARRSGDHQESPAYRFDALVELICGIGPAEPAGSGAGGPEADGCEVGPAGSDPHPTLFPGGGRRPGGDAPSERAGPGPPPGSKRASRPRVDMVIRVDFESIRRGYVEGDETCEVAGVGPISVAAATDYLTEAALKFVLTNATDIRAVAHLGRNIGAPLRTALLWKYRRCSTPGCDRALGLEQDHRFPVGKGGWTALENLQLLCRSCHDDKTRRDYPNGTAYLRRSRDSKPAA